MNSNDTEFGYPLFVATFFCVSVFKSYCFWVFLSKCITISRLQINLNKAAIMILSFDLIQFYTVYDLAVYKGKRARLSLCINKVQHKDGILQKSEYIVLKSISAFFNSNAESL